MEINIGFLRRQIDCVFALQKTTRSQGVCIQARLGYIVAQLVCVPWGLRKSVNAVKKNQKKEMKEKELKENTNQLCKSYDIQVRLSVWQLVQKMFHLSYPFCRLGFLLDRQDFSPFVYPLSHGLAMAESHRIQSSPNINDQQTICLGKLQLDL